MRSPHFGDTLLRGAGQLSRLLPSRAGFEKVNCDALEDNVEELMPWVQDAKVNMKICKAALVIVDGEHDRRLSGALNMAGSKLWAKGEEEKLALLRGYLGRTQRRWPGRSRRAHIYRLKMQ